MLKRDIVIELEYISKKYKLDFLVLFDLKSEKINLAYYQKENNIKINYLRTDINRIVNTEFNLIDLNNKNSCLIKEVVYKKGFKIYVRDEEIYRERKFKTFLHSYNVLKLMKNES